MCLILKSKYIFRDAHKSTPYNKNLKKNYSKIKDRFFFINFEN